MIAMTDGLLTSTAPWKLLKVEIESSHAQAKDILYQAAEAIRLLTALLYPFLPYATAKVWAQLGLGDIERPQRTAN